MTLIIAAIMAAAHLYIGWRLYAAAARCFSRNFFKWLPICFLASFYLLPVAALGYHFFVAAPYLLAWPKALTYWFWFGLIFSFQVATWLLVLDAIQLAARGLGAARNRVRFYHSRVVFILAGVLFVFTAVKMVWQTRVIQTDYISFESDNIPQGFQDFRLVHISDLQGDEYTGRPEIAEYISKVNKLKPDLVLFTGDLISYGTEYIDMTATELSKATAKHGVYAVIGDHDYWAGVPNIKTALARYGIPLLQDENEIITTGEDSLLLTGITEVYSKHIARDSLQALSNAYGEKSIKIMVSHQATAKVVQAAVEAGYELLLAGHTHGGQLRVPFLGMTFSAAERETSYLSGVHKAGKLFININNGLGFTLAPVRYNAPPNISVIDFSQVD